MTINIVIRSENTPLQAVNIFSGHTEAAAGANFLVQEVDGTSRFTLEDGSGSILLEV